MKSIIRLSSFPSSVFVSLVKCVRSHGVGGKTPLTWQQWYYSEVGTQEGQEGELRSGCQGEDASPAYIFFSFVGRLCNLPEQTEDFDGYMKTEEEHKCKGDTQFQFEC